MNQRSWIDPRVAQVSAEQMRAYMLDHGWKLQPYPRPELLVFGGQVDDHGLPIIQVLPSSERMSDFRIRVEELLGSLGALEDRYAGDILSDVLRYPKTVATMSGSVDGANRTPAPK